jgi:hypothetical protein
VACNIICNIAPQAFGQAVIQENEIPKHDFGPVLLDYPDGTIGCGYQSNNSNTLYVMDGFSIDSKNIPGLNAGRYLDGSSFYPAAVPYKDWSRFDIQYFTPQFEYAWDAAAGGYRSIYAGSRFAFYDADKVYQKNDLPANATIIEMQKFIPMLPHQRVLPEEKVNIDETNSSSDEMPADVSPKRDGVSSPPKVGIVTTDQTSTTPLSDYFFLVTILVFAALVILWIYRALDKGSSKNGRR